MSETLNTQTNVETPPEAVAPPVSAPPQEAAPPPATPTTIGEARHQLLQRYSGQFAEQTAEPPAEEQDQEEIPATPAPPQAPPVTQPQTTQQGQDPYQLISIMLQSSDPIIREHGAQLAQAMVKTQSPPPPEPVETPEQTSSRIRTEVENELTAQFMKQEPRFNENTEFIGFDQKSTFNPKENPEHKALLESQVKVRMLEHQMQQREESARKSQQDQAAASDQQIRSQFDGLLSQFTTRGVTVSGVTSSEYFSKGANGQIDANQAATFKQMCVNYLGSEQCAHDLAQMDAQRPGFSSDKTRLMQFAITQVFHNSWRPLRGSVPPLTTGAGHANTNTSQPPQAALPPQRGKFPESGFLKNANPPNQPEAIGSNPATSDSKIKSIPGTKPTPESVVSQLRQMFEI